MRGSPARRGVQGWLLAGAIVATGCLVALGLERRGSTTDHARSAIQSLFVNPVTSRETGHIRNCDQIGTNAEARIYLCDIVAPNCIRLMRFTVYRQSIYGARPTSASTYTLQHLCAPAHY